MVSSRAEWYICYPLDLFSPVSVVVIVPILIFSIPDFGAAIKRSRIMVDG